ncbi:glycosyl transferase [Amycolatopsis mediterranei S699]|uniref:Glycosyl transferase n=2 Tax=Amycolatopsis mediterranei TaxID=33910 RepID=A0A0H3DDM6_AMYMU|nr:glycosyl transferase [Amycolatopsis mediterranei U32]AEK45241.1 glycosyl transferase [Amycolatopsis mediterranei S699]AFO80033.1 glycosyl transferase [Amycolatopsis mediterranei S699]AGT87161.1 glycosyl transferase [Amycolatopsis mediterranei RB]KDU86724.1 glycosyl transferase [Amycolatopsis mediterranei]
MVLDGRREAVLHFQNPFTTDLQNYPRGVNMAANAAMFGLNIPLAPLTLTFGATLTWAIVLTAGLAGTATGWYWVFSRHLVPNRTAAAIGGAFCGFAPPMISHGNAHPNFVVLFVLPFIALKTIQIAHNERPVRNGIVLGLLVAWQILLGEEPLAIFALTFLVFAVAYLIPHRAEVRGMLAPLAKGIPIGAVVTLLIAGFPLYWQFFGPQSFHSLLHGAAGNDTAAFTRFATQSVAGAPEAAADVSMNRTEENAFFGWPLIVLMVMLTIWLWRDVVSRALAITMYVMAFLSLGVEITVAHDDTGVAGPWKWLGRLPLLDSVLESRLAMGCIPVVGALLAIATHRVWTAAAQQPAPVDGQPAFPLRMIWVGAVVAVLLPIAPTELVTHQRPLSPPFFADGIWRQYVAPGGSLVPVPLPSTGEAEPLHWQVDAGLGYPMPEGYFVGPTSPDDRRGRYGAVPLPTSDLFAQVERTGQAAEVTEADRTQALADLRAWNADVLVVGPRQNQEALKSTVELLLRKPAEFVGGVWIWDVRPLTA